MVNFGDAITKISSKDIILGKPGRELATGFLKNHISEYTKNVGDSFTKNLSKPFYAEDFHGKLSANILIELTEKQKEKIINSFKQLMMVNQTFY